MSLKTNTDNKFLTWKARLDQLCNKLYLVDTSDMGFDDEQLTKFWHEDYIAEDLADYFGTKYNLTLAQEVMIDG